MRLSEELCCTPIVMKFKKRIKGGVVKSSFIKVNSSQYIDLNAQGVNQSNLKDKWLVLVANTQWQVA